MFFMELRAFLLRVFLPAYWRLAMAWAYGYDLILIAGGLVLFGWAAARDPSRRPLLLFGAAAIAISLAPALPLTISLATTETERVVYIPTAFGALVTIVAAESLIRGAAIRTALMTGLIVAHGLFLQRFTRTWVEAGIAFDSNVRTFIESVRAHDPGPDGQIFVTNMPDNVRGAFVFRRGFYEALHFHAPDLYGRRSGIVGISSHSLGKGTEPSVFTRFGPLEFGVDVGPNRFVQTGPPARPPFEFVS